METNLAIEKKVKITTNQYYTLFMMDLSFIRFSSNIFTRSSQKDGDTNNKINLVFEIHLLYAVSHAQTMVLNNKPFATIANLIFV